MDLSVVIPVHNEKDNLWPLIEEIRSALSGKLDYEVIVVDDGSDDGTFDRADEMRAEFPRLRVLHHGANCGQSASIVSGVRSARAPTVAMLDGDGQNDPGDIIALFRRFTERGPEGGLAAVVGNRRQRHDSWLKRLASRIANAVRGRLLGDQTPDTGCGLKVFSRTAFLRLPYFDHMHRFLPALLQRDGGRVESVDVRHRARRTGKSHYGVADRLWVGIADLLGVMWLQRRNRRCPVADKED